MKQFNKRVHWHFHLAIDGFGRNCAEALTNALNKALIDLDDWKATDSLEAIEAHEVDLIDEGDIEDDQL